MPHVDRLAGFLLLTTLALVGLGGVVHTTGSSLACPDWPLCNGEWMPVMRGGVAYEHSHRLLASAVALGVAALPFAVSRARPRARRLALFALVLVIVQALLGALTVIHRLPPPVSIAHLLTATFLVAVLGAVTVELRQAPRLPSSAHLAALTQFAIAALVVQIGLGGMVRHLLATYACGADPIGCAPALDLFAPAILQVAHRVVGVFVLGLVTLVAALAQRDPLATAATRTSARLPLCLALAQVGLGMASVAWTSPIALVTMHLVLAELLLLSLVFLAVRSSTARSPVTGDGVRCRASTVHAGIDSRCDDAESLRRRSAR